MPRRRRRGCWTRISQPTFTRSAAHPYACGGMELPVFRYHPDPVRTGSIQPSDNECVCCRKRRGHIYMGPVFAEPELDESLCPWCISDGSAHETFDAEFTDASMVGLG